MAAVKDLFRICSGPLPVSSEASPGVGSGEADSETWLAPRAERQGRAGGRLRHVLAVLPITCVMAETETETEAETETDGKSCVNIERPNCPDSTSHFTSYLVQYSSQNRECPVECQPKIQIFAQLARAQRSSLALGNKTPG